mmetsp:Transcript_29794/g.89138  ORF Transcript_29794/g.89138 Transcript_29794/m.89138 type:complete len:282 (+) Transcript_29794:1583-2428(+)
MRCGKQQHLDSDRTNSSLPQRCDGSKSGDECGPNPYVIVSDDCTQVALSEASFLEFVVPENSYTRYVDQQTLKLQEMPEAVPAGDMPRSILLVAEGWLVDRVSPGARVSALGMSSLFESTNNKKTKNTVAAIRMPYLKVVGIELDTSEHGNKILQYTPAEEEFFVKLSRRPDIYNLLSASIAPSIQGDYTADIKKALLCQLMGGCRKTLSDGIRLRGDINILLLGDPSTAKSQFLKFVEKAAPVGIYTSGKGSSAAGLTASVIRDAKKQRVLPRGRCHGAC